MTALPAPAGLVPAATARLALSPVTDASGLHGAGPAFSGVSDAVLRDVHAGHRHVPDERDAAPPTRRVTARPAGTCLHSLALPWQETPPPGRRVAPGVAWTPVGQ